MGSYATAVVILSLFGAAPEPAADTAITWENDYGKALAETRLNELPLLVVLDSPGNRQGVVKTVSMGQGSNVPASEDLLKQYVRCHIDVSTEYGKRVASAFKATTLPHVAIIDKTGSKIISRTSGQLTQDQWQATLIRHKEGLVPVSATSVHARRLRANRRATSSTFNRAATARVASDIDNHTVRH